LGRAALPRKGGLSVAVGPYAGRFSRPGHSPSGAACLTRTTYVFVAEATA